MSNHNIRSVVARASKNMLELSTAIQKCGGSVSGLEDSSLGEFLEICALNGIELTATVVRQEEN